MRAVTLTERARVHAHNALYHVSEWCSRLAFALCVTLVSCAALLWAMFIVTVFVLDSYVR